MTSSGVGSKLPMHGEPEILSSTPDIPNGKTAWKFDLQAMVGVKILEPQHTRLTPNGARESKNIVIETVHRFVSAWARMPEKTEDGHYTESSAGMRLTCERDIPQVFDCAICLGYCVAAVSQNLQGEPPVIHLDRLQGMAAYL